jgi:hypothetical protein
MTLRCECGGAVTLQDYRARGGEERDVIEWYECAECSDMGRLRLCSGTVESVRGCLEREEP